MVPQTETRAGAGYKTRIKNYKCLYNRTPSFVRNPQVFAAFRMTPQPGVPPEKDRASLNYPNSENFLLNEHLINNYYCVSVLLSSPKILFLSKFFFKKQTFLANGNIKNYKVKAAINVKEMTMSSLPLAVLTNIEINGFAKKFFEEGIFLQISRDPNQLAWNWNAAFPGTIGASLQKNLLLKTWTGQEFLVFCPILIILVGLVLYIYNWISHQDKKFFYQDFILYDVDRTKSFPYSTELKKQLDLFIVVVQETYNERTVYESASSAQDFHQMMTRICKKNLDKHDIVLNSNNIKTYQDEFQKIYVFEASSYMKKRNELEKQYKNLLATATFIVVYTLGTFSGGQNLVVYCIDFILVTLLSFFPKFLFEYVVFVNFIFVIHFLIKIYIYILYISLVSQVSIRLTERFELKENFIPGTYEDYRTFWGNYMNNVKLESNETK